MIEIYRKSICCVPLLVSVLFYAGEVVADSEVTVWQELTVKSQNPDHAEHTVAVRRSVLGQIQCASFNHHDCLWDQDALRVLQGRPDDHNLQPFNCGLQSVAAYGNDGYSVKGHWCAVADTKWPAKQRTLVRKGEQVYAWEGFAADKWNDLDSWTQLIPAEMPKPRALVASGSRIGYLATNGTFYAKEGNLAAQWHTVAVNATAIAISSSEARDELDRVGYIDTQGNFLVKSGGLDGSSWMTLNVPGTIAKKMVLSGNRVGYLDQDGNFRVKVGADLLKAPWVLEAAHEATDIALSSNALQDDEDRIAYINSRGELLVKVGGVSASWTVLALPFPGEVLPKWAIYGDWIGGSGKNESARLSVRWRQGSLNGPWKDIGGDTPRTEVGAFAVGYGAATRDHVRVGYIDRYGDLLMSVPGPAGDSWVDYPLDSRQPQGSHELYFAGPVK